MPLVRADLAHLPFARESLDAAWARNSYFHVPARELPLALAELHRVLRPGARIAVTLVNRGGVKNPPRRLRPGLASLRQRDAGFRGRLFVAGDAEDWRALFVGAGFASVGSKGPIHSPSAETRRAPAGLRAPRMRLSSAD
jgi:SAM-dependent methyltransferase